MHVSYTPGKPILEEIVEVIYFYDMPRSGVAFFLGKKCYFEFEFDTEVDDYSHIVLLRPIPDEIIEIIKSNRLIWEDGYNKWKKSGSNSPLDIEIPKESKAKYNAQKAIVDNWINSAREVEFCSHGNIASHVEIKSYSERWDKDCCENPLNLDYGAFWDIKDHNLQHKKQF